MVLTAVAAILIFSLVIFIHELGHFLAAKKFGVKVNEFAIGMGPVIFSFERGETLYRLRLLPIGGFVAMEGEDEESDHERSFSNLPKLKKAVIMVAGAVMNLLLGFLVMLIMVSSNEMIASRTVSGFTVENSSAEASGLMVDDTIVGVNGRRVYITNDIMYELARTQENSAELTVQRGDETVTLNEVKFDTIEHEDGYVQFVPGFSVYGLEKTFFAVIDESFRYTLSIARVIFLSLIDLVTGRVAINNLSGPVGIITVISDAVSVGLDSLLFILAMLTVNLGIFNLLPFPALDGGRLFLLLIEAIIRRPIPQKYEIVINGVGFVLLMALMLFVTFNDVTKLIDF